MMKPLANCIYKNLTLTENPSDCYKGLLTSLMRRIIYDLPYNVVVNLVETQYGDKVNGKSNKWSGVVGKLIEKVRASI